MRRPFYPKVAAEISTLVEKYQKITKSIKSLKNTWKTMVEQLKSYKKIENMGFLLAYAGEFS